MGSPPMNLLRGSLTEMNGSHVFRKDDFSVALSYAANIGATADLPVVLGIRPDEVRIGPVGGTGMTARVLLVEPRGSEAIVTLETSGQIIKAVVAPDVRPLEGGDVTLDIDKASLVLFSGETDRRLPLMWERAA
jgi:multiple sugar transport system ATP-binding protein